VPIFRHSGHYCCTCQSLIFSFFAGTFNPEAIRIELGGAADHKTMPGSFHPQLAAQNEVNGLSGRTSAFATSHIEGSQNWFRIGCKCPKCNSSHESRTQY
jgi:hypothetical protein